MSGDWLYAPDGYTLRRILDEFAGGRHISGVIHCGAWHGEEAHYYAECGISNVWWVEGNPNVIPMLRAKLEPMGHHVIEAILGDVDGPETTLHITNEDGLSSSLLEFGRHKEFSPNMVYVEDVTGPMRTLDSLVAEHEIRNINMLVMDLQGAEGMCLAGAQQLLPQLEIVYSEVNTGETYIGCVLLRDLDRMLLGFARKKTWMVGDLGWGDAVYVRDEGTAAAMTVGQATMGVGGQWLGGSLPNTVDDLAGINVVVREAGAPAPVAQAVSVVDPTVNVLVPSWNCSAWIERCLQSLKSQTWKPERVVVIDDCSTQEGYYELVEDLLRPYPWSVVRTPANQKMPRNLWWALHELGLFSDPDCIIFLLDGDDYLPPHAIERITQAYRDPNVWLTWGSYERDGQYAGYMPNPATPWPAQVAALGNYREHLPWVPFNHPLTFRRWLFDHLTEADFKDDAGEWFTAGYDFALFMPLTELASGPEHGRFIQESLYIYNEGNPESDAKIRAGECGRVHSIVRARARRQPLVGVSR